MKKNKKDTILLEAIEKISQELAKTNEKLVDIDRMVRLNLVKEDRDILVYYTVQNVDSFEYHMDFDHRKFTITLFPYGMHKKDFTGPEPYVENLQAIRINSNLPDDIYINIKMAINSNTFTYFHKGRLPANGHINVLIKDEKKTYCFTKGNLKFLYNYTTGIFVHDDLK